MARSQWASSPGESSNPVASRTCNQRGDLSLREDRGDRTTIELFLTGLEDWASGDVSAGLAGPRHAYGQAYRKTAWLSHCAAGPSSGEDKILERFYGDERADGRRACNRRRELPMLRRLRYNDEQLIQYVESAQAAETCT